ncbi:MAG: shikimate dehydrogenase [Luteolibacter sp.]
MEHFYTLENLEEATVGNKPARLAVIGCPVEHSASPQLHQPVLDALGIHASYIRLQVRQGEVTQAFEKMRKLGFIGCNVTVPHKFDAMDCCTEVAEQARILGAVNTVIFSGKTISGFNSDGPGIESALGDAFGLKLAESNCVVIGAGGGAGQAIATQFALGNAREITLVNRDQKKIIKLAQKLKSISPETKIHFLGFDSPDLKARCHVADLLLQTTSLGLRKDDPPVIPSDCFTGKQFVYDTIYQPVETPFLREAAQAGCQVENGLSLLVHQAAISFQEWFPDTDPLPFMLKATTNR